MGDITPGGTSGQAWGPGVFKGLHLCSPYVSAKGHNPLWIQGDNSHKSQDGLKIGITSLPVLCLMIHGLAGSSTGWAKAVEE